MSATVKHGGGSLKVASKVIKNYLQHKEEQETLEVRVSSTHDRNIECVWDYMKTQKDVRKPISSPRHLEQATCRFPSKTVQVYLEELILVTKYWFDLDFSFVHSLYFLFIYLFFMKMNTLFHMHFFNTCLKLAQYLHSTLYRVQGFRGRATGRGSEAGGRKSWGVAVAQEVEVCEEDWENVSHCCGKICCHCPTGRAQDTGRTRVLSCGSCH